MSPANTRKLLQWGHFAASGVIGTYLYSPWSAHPVLSGLTLYVVFPAMALSGLWMWNQGRINRFLRRRNA